MHEFSSGSRACSLEKFLNLDSEMPFPGLWGEILQNSDGQKMVLLGNPLGLGSPGFSRSEPIVVTPRAIACWEIRVHQ